MPISAPLYAQRDLEALDAKGDYYFRHAMAITAENLSSKSEIAAELGFRDMQIDALRAELAAVQQRADTAETELKEILKGMANAYLESQEEAAHGSL